MSAADIAVQAALSQLGKPYIWGAADPAKGFDCSGILSWAWGKAGINFPHQSEEQRKSMTAVPTNQMRPGDFVFFGSPAYHVAMYLGDGKILQAPTSGDVVKISNLSDMSDLTGAGRPNYDGAFAPYKGPSSAIPLNDPALGGGSKPQTAAGLAGGAGLGPYLQLFNTVPELKQLMASAIGSGLSAEDFADQVHKSKWWATHSDNVRQLAALKVADPATYKQKFDQTVAQVNTAIRQLGIPLTVQQTVGIANRALNSGISGDTQWFTRQVAGMANFSKATSTSGLHGLMAQTVQALEQASSQYGQQWTPVQYLVRAQQILMGNQTPDSYKQTLINQAKAMFPGLAAQIDGGATVEDLASPYKQSMAQILEINPQGLTLRDPLLKAALQGNVASGRQPLALWQFEDGLRKDPRWDKTDNAKQSYAQAVAKIGADWGYSA